MKHKKSLIVFTALFSVAVFISIFLMMWFWGDQYPDFNTTTFREEIAIPGLKDGACPQGLAMSKQNVYNKNGDIEYDNTDSEGKPAGEPKKQDYYLVSAYFKDKPSRIYVTGKQSGYLGYVSLTYHGEPFYGHVGGVATDKDGKVLWLGSENKVYCVKSTNKDYNVIEQIILNCISGDTFELDPDTTTNSVFEINGSASFVSYYRASTSTGKYTEKLYVGEFYRAGNYETPSSHHVTLPDGSKNRAFMYEFNVSTSTEYGLSKKTDDSKMSVQVPRVDKIFSIPDRIQGAALVSGSNDSGDILVLSQSYGLDNSEILLYNFSTIETSGNSISYSSIDPNGNNFPYAGVTVESTGRQYYSDTNISVYYVYGNSNSKTTNGNGNKIYPSFIKSFSIPSMTEGLAVGSDDRVNILFESAANKYKAFVRQPIDKIYSFRPSRGGR